MVADRIRQFKTSIDLTKSNGINTSNNTYPLHFTLLDQSNMVILQPMYKKCWGKYPPMISRITFRPLLSNGNILQYMIGKTILFITDIKMFSSRSVEKTSKTTKIISCNQILEFIITVLDRNISKDTAVCKWRQMELFRSS